MTNQKFAQLSISQFRHFSVETDLRSVQNVGNCSNTPYTRLKSVVK